MTVLLDNTVLSNFVSVQQLGLVPLAFVEDVATTLYTLREMQAGAALGKIPLCDWGWLTTVELTPDEQQLFQDLSARLGKGEASCLAVAIHRGHRLATDDKDARRYARRSGVPLTGTVGILAALVKNGCLAVDEGNRLLQEMVAAG